MAMRSEARVEAEVEEEESFGPQPLNRLEVYKHVTVNDEHILRHIYCM